MDQVKVVGSLGSLCAIATLLTAFSSLNVTVNGTEQVLVHTSWLAAQGSVLFAVNDELTKQIFGGDPIMVPTTQEEEGA